jgi:hypothetical protein
MSASLLQGAATGPGAGAVSEAIALGTPSAGVVAFTTAADVTEDVLVEVTFDIDPILSATFAVTQVTGSGIGATLAHTVQSTPNGFTITATATPVANTLYVFTWT